MLRDLLTREPGSLPYDWSDAGVADAGIELSVGSRADAYDNPLAETVIGLVKTEVIRRRGPIGRIRIRDPSRD